HADGLGELALELDEESTVRGDRAHALALELARAVDERPQQPRRALADDTIRIGAGDAVVADGKRKGRGVAHVAGDARKPRVEHEDPDREAVLVEAARDAPGRHGPYSTLLLPFEAP